MNNDLISREALKEEVKTLFCPDGYKIMFLERIDSAPTISPSLNLENITEADIEKFKIIWQRANSKGLSPIIEDRPQGEWIEISVKRDLLYNTGIKYTCSICGKGNCYGKPPFCMYCGAKMKG